MGRSHTMRNEERATWEYAEMRYAKDAENERTAEFRAPFSLLFGLYRRDRTNKRQYGTKRYAWGNCTSGTNDACPRQAEQGGELHRAMVARVLRHDIIRDLPTPNNTQTGGYDMPSGPRR